MQLAQGENLRVVVRPKKWWPFCQQTDLLTMPGKTIKKKYLADPGTAKGCSTKTSFNH